MEATVTEGIFLKQMTSDQFNERKQVLDDRLVPMARALEKARRGGEAEAAVTQCAK
jgi:hypothetical protein